MILRGEQCATGIISIRMGIIRTSFLMTIFGIGMQANLVVREVYCRTMSGIRRGGDDEKYDETRTCAL